MEFAVAYLILGAIVLGIVVAALTVRFFKRGRKPRLTRPGLVEHAKAMSSALADFANKRETRRPSREAVLAGGGEYHRDHPDRYIDLYDVGTRAIYDRDYLPEIEVLREEFALRGVREKALDKVYGSPDRIADVRTISTALLVMAQRLR